VGLSQPIHAGARTNLHSIHRLLTPIPALLVAEVHILPAPVLDAIFVAAAHGIDEFRLGHLGAPHAQLHRVGVLLALLHF